MDNQMENQTEKKPRKNTTSCAVRNRWNAKHYDRINITLPKGYGEMFKEYCADKDTTMNALLGQIIKFDIEQYELAHSSAAIGAEAK